MSDWLLLFVALGVEPTSWPAEASTGRSLLAVLIVLGLVAVLGWQLRRGSFGIAARRARTGMAIESAVPLGDRRQLVVVSVEGRRLLLGLTPAHVSLVTELAATPPTFDRTLDRTLTPSPGDPS